MPQHRHGRSLPLWRFHSPCRRVRLRGRTYTVLSGRTRRSTRRSLTRCGDRRGSFGNPLSFSLWRSAFLASARSVGVTARGLTALRSPSRSTNFHRGLRRTRDCRDHSSARSSYGAVTATITVVFGFIAARMLSKSRTKATRLLDFLLLAAVALPSVVFGAGYIFAYNLPFLNKIGLDLYQTTTLLIIGYIDSRPTPTNARVLVGSVSQVQSSLHHDAARAHGAGPIVAWAPACFLSCRARSSWRGY